MAEDKKKGPQDPKHLVKPTAGYRVSVPSEVIETGIGGAEESERQFYTAPDPATLIPLAPEERYGVVERITLPHNLGQPPIEQPATGTLPETQPPIETDQGTITQPFQGFQREPATAVVVPAVPFIQAFEETAGETGVFTQEVVDETRAPTPAIPEPTQSFSARELPQLDLPPPEGRVLDMRMEPTDPEMPYAPTIAVEDPQTRLHNRLDGVVIRDTLKDTERPKDELGLNLEERDYLNRLAEQTFPRNRKALEQGVQDAKKTNARKLGIVYDKVLLALDQERDMLAEVLNDEKLANRLHDARIRFFRGEYRQAELVLQRLADNKVVKEHGPHDAILAALEVIRYQPQLKQMLVGAETVGEIPAAKPEVVQPELPPVEQPRHALLLPPDLTLSGTEAPEFRIEDLERYQPEPAEILGTAFVETFAPTSGETGVHPAPVEQPAQHAQPQPLAGEPTISRAVVSGLKSLPFGEFYEEVARAGEIRAEELDRALQGVIAREREDEEQLELDPSLAKAEEILEALAEPPRYFAEFFESRDHQNYIALHLSDLIIFYNRTKKAFVSRKDSRQIRQWSAQVHRPLSEEQADKIRRNYYTEQAEKRPWEFADDIGYMLGISPKKLRREAARLEQSLRRQKDAWGQAATQGVRHSFISFLEQRAKDLETTELQEGGIEVIPPQKSPPPLPARVFKPTAEERAYLATFDERVMWALAGMDYDGVVTAREVLTAHAQALRAGEESKRVRALPAPQHREANIAVYKPLTAEQRVGEGDAREAQPTQQPRVEEYQLRFERSLTAEKLRKLTRAVSRLEGIRNTERTLEQFFGPWEKRAEKSRKDRAYFYLQRALEHGLRAKDPRFLADDFDNTAGKKTIRQRRLEEYGAALRDLHTVWKLRPDTPLLERKRIGYEVEILELMDHAEQKGDIPSYQAGVHALEYREGNWDFIVKHVLGQPDRTVEKQDLEKARDHEAFCNEIADLISDRKPRVPIQGGITPKELSRAIEASKRRYWERQGFNYEEVRRGQYAHRFVAYLVERTKKGAERLLPAPQPAETAVREERVLVAEQDETQITRPDDIIGEDIFVQYGPPRNDAILCIGVDRIGTIQVPYESERAQALLDSTNWEQLSFMFPETAQERPLEEKHARVERPSPQHLTYQQIAAQFIAETRKTEEAEARREGRQALVDLIATGIQNHEEIRQRLVADLNIQRIQEDEEQLELDFTGSLARAEEILEGIPTHAPEEMYSVTVVRNRHGKFHLVYKIDDLVLYGNPNSGALTRLPQGMPQIPWVSHGRLEKEEATRVLHHFANTQPEQFGRYMGDLLGVKGERQPPQLSLVSQEEQRIDTGLEVVPLIEQDQEVEVISIRTVSPPPLPAQVFEPRPLTPEDRAYLATFDERVMWALAGMDYDRVVTAREVLTAHAQALRAGEESKRVRALPAPQHREADIAVYKPLTAEQRAQKVARLADPTVVRVIAETLTIMNEGGYEEIIARMLEERQQTAQRSFLDVLAERAEAVKTGPEIPARKTEAEERYNAVAQEAYLAVVGYRENRMIDAFRHARKFEQGVMKLSNLNVYPQRIEYAIIACSKQLKQIKEDTRLVVEKSLEDARYALQEGERYATRQKWYDIIGDPDQNATGQYQIAKENFKAVLEYHPEHEEAKTAVVDLEARLSELEQRQKAKAEEKPEERNADYYFDRGLKAHEQERLLPAEMWYKVALKADPEHVLTLTNLGLIALEQGEYKEALALELKASRAAVKQVEKDEEGTSRFTSISPVVKLHLADAYAANEKSRPAERIYKRVLKDHAGTAYEVDAFMGLAEVARSKGDTTMAMHYLDDAREAAEQLGMRTHHIDYNLGVLLQQRGHVESAKQSYEDAVEGAPKGQREPTYEDRSSRLVEGFALNNLGVLAEGREAEEYFARAMRADPSNVLAMTNWTQMQH